MVSSFKGLFFIFCQSIDFLFICGEETLKPRPEICCAIENNILTDCLGQFIIVSCSCNFELVQLSYCLCTYRTPQETLTNKTCLAWGGEGRNGIVYDENILFLIGKQIKNDMLTRFSSNKGIHYCWN